MTQTKALVVYCHPRPESFNAAVKAKVLANLQRHGVETQVVDLYADGFDPTLTGHGLEVYEDCTENKTGLAAYCDQLAWCNTLIFVYPTWWYGLPAVLKGFLDRVLVPGVAFHLPDGGGAIAPGLQHITRLGVFTTCGASWGLTRFIGAPGRRTLMRGVRLLCAKRCKTAFAAHYNMDSSTDASRGKHLERVDRAMDKFLKGA